METFTNTLSLLQSTDNDVRKKAEEQYDSYPPAEKVGALMEVFVKSENVEFKLTSLVYLRRVISRDWDDIWEALNDENKQRSLQKVLELVIQPNDLQIRKRLAEVVAEIASNLIEDETGKQQWGDLLAFMDHCVSTENDVPLLYVGLLIITNAPNLFGTALAKYLEKMKVLFSRGLSCSEPEIRALAVRAVVNFSIDNEEEKHLVKEMATLVPAILQVCSSSSSQEDDTEGPFGSLAELAQLLPKILTPHIFDVLSLCIATTNNKDLPETVRQNALEVTVAYAETAPKSLKKHASSFIPPMIETCMMFMADLEDDLLEEWLEEIDEDDLEEAPSIGESSLDRIACSLHGKAVLPTILQIVERYLGSADWKMRHAGLRAFSTVGEGCKRTMEPQIEIFVAHIAKFTSDEHPRVRYSACNALGLMSSDFCPTLQKKCHKDVIASLLKCMEDTACARVCAHACSSISNFCEGCPKTIIAPYLSFLLEGLEKALEASLKQLSDKKCKLIVENAVQAISSVAESAKDYLKDHYARLMTSLIYILQHSDVEDLKELRGKTIECISFIGLAVGKEVFGADAVNILNLLSPSMTSMEIDDPQYSFMISSWNRFCEILKEDFIPFLSVVMLPVIRAAEYRPSLSVYDAEEKESDDEDSGYDYPAQEPEDKGTISFRTSGLEEKSIACEMLINFARDMNTAFLPWVDKVAEVCTTNLNFQIDDSVRHSAAQTIPHLLNCVKDQGAAAQRRLWSTFFPLLCNAIRESEVEASEFFASIADCITSLTKNGLTKEEFIEIFSLLNSELPKYAKRKMERLSRDEEEEGEPEELDEESEMESYYLDCLSGLVNVLMETTKGEAYESLLPIFGACMELVRSENCFFERQQGMCILDSAIEFGPEHLGSRFDYLPVMIKLFSDESPAVRQATAYGAGIMAFRCAEIPNYKNDVLQLLEPLAAMIGREDARSTEDTAVATENAISAFAKILMNVQLEESMLNHGIDMFVNWLPTHVDKVESPHVYGFLCKLFHGNHPALLGPNGERVPHILRIALSAIRDAAFEEDSEEGVTAKNDLIGLIREIKAKEHHFPNLIEKAQLDESLVAIYQN
ncbi:unnamed protein product [Caenorhabditis auriculariae]|uniref:Importin N-terminal domain-containing protein n=1 Tax=Caenorhabditis auriculariae TaxID=2777116 RepID=A0A8S1GWM9_9PELO|nr:unnamed protein product [Caenorhabditis auriculariae]